MRATGVLLLLAASVAFAAPLKLDHDALTARARIARPTANLVYEPSLALRFIERRYMMGWPVRVEAHFVREGMRVRVKADRVLVSGVLQPNELAGADAKIGLLVNEETTADVVEIRKKGVLVYRQFLGPPPTPPAPAVPVRVASPSPHPEE